MSNLVQGFEKTNLDEKYLLTLIHPVNLCYHSDFDPLLYDYCQYILVNVKYFDLESFQICLLYHEWLSPDTNSSQHNF